MSGSADIVRVTKSGVRTVVEKPLPPMTERMKNIGEATLAAIRHPATVDANEQQRRLLICQTSCEEYRESDGRCAKCGCFMTFKTRLEAWHCPLGKW